MSSRNVFAALMLLTTLWPPLALGQRDSESKLVRTLTGRNEAIRMRSLAAVETDPSGKRQRLPDLVSAARKLATESSSESPLRPSVVRLIYLVASIDDDAAEELLVELLDSDHAGMVMICADALGKNKFHGSIGDLGKQVSRSEYVSSYAFRFNLVRSLAQMEHPDAIELLSDMRLKLDGQLRYQIEKILNDVTINLFQGDQDRFEAWQKDKQSDRVFQTAGFEPESLNRIQFGRPQQYYGIDIHAKRVMFIIDHSGSMKKYWGGMTRLERAKWELIRAIQELPDEHEFAIVTYHTNVNQWRDELVEASDENKQEAIQFVRRLGYGSKTNTYRALRESLEFDDDLEAVFLLTDGQPTEGKIIAPLGIVQDILHRNRFRHLNFNTIGIAVGGPTEQFLRTLADESAGEFRKAL